MESTGREELRIVFLSRFLSFTEQCALLRCEVGCWRLISLSLRWSDLSGDVGEWEGCAWVCGCGCVCVGAWWGVWRVTPTNANTTAACEWQELLTGEHLAFLSVCPK